MMHQTGDCIFHYRKGLSANLWRDFNISAPLAIKLRAAYRSRYSSGVMP